MILQVVFGTLLFAFFIKIDELNAASYNSPTAPTNLYNIEENDKTGSRILRYIALKYGDGRAAVPEAEKIDKLSLLRKRDVNNNTVSIGNETVEIKNVKEFRSVFVSAVVTGIGTAVGGNAYNEVKDGIKKILEWIG